MNRPLALGCLFAAIALPAIALDWQADKLTVTTAPFQATQDVVFAFKNNSAKPVALLDLQTNCDCLDATADQKTYAPGAAGTIKARFTIGDRSGLYERIITVVTDEGTSPVRLLVRIEVPEVADLAPRSVSWPVKADATEKTVEITPATGLEITFSDAQATNDAFTTRLETVEAGKRYRLHLRPKSTADSASAAIRIFGHDKTGHDVVVSAYANVQ
jgi:hypothetical protein